MGRHRDDESSGSVIEASVRLSAQPAILHYKALTRRIASALRASTPMVSLKFLPEKVGK
jgi:hypothetical protein